VECAGDDSNGEMLAVKEKRLERERRTFWRPSLVVERGVLVGRLIATWYEVYFARRDNKVERASMLNFSQTRLDQ
jgi:hypothetical protein